MSEPTGALTEAEKIEALTRIFLNLLSQYGH